MTESETWLKAARILELYHFAIANAGTYEESSRLLYDLHKEYILNSRTSADQETKSL